MEGGAGRPPSAGDTPPGRWYQHRNITHHERGHEADNEGNRRAPLPDRGGSNQPDSRWVKCTRRLTTIPRDPFLTIRNYQECLQKGIVADACRVLSLLRGTYWYADYDGHDGSIDHNIGAFYPNVAPLYGLRPMQKGEWVILGVGTDNRPESINAYLLRGIPYDPSNGLISQGDLYVRSSGEATTGVR